MKENINTPEYWEGRFSSGDWESNQGRWQTRSFAESQIPHLKINSNFAGTILDFGCGLGDAMPVYREHFPHAKLHGVDISDSAIKQCQEKYGSMATFHQGNHESIADVDVIIASNILEHLSNDVQIAKNLLSKCKTLYIIVPYNEVPLHLEHINKYDEGHYPELGAYDYTKYLSVDWSAYVLRKLWFKVYFKNIFRFLVSRPLRNRNLQIMFHFQNK